MKCVSKMTNRIRVQKQLSTSELAEPISILKDLAMFRVACVTNEFFEGGEMRPIYSYVSKKPVPIIEERMGV